MNKLTRISATVASSVALVAGFAGVAGASPASITTTGPDSSNEVDQRHDVRTRLNNDNRVRVTNNNPQTARTGEAKVDHNTRGGDAESGTASNQSDLVAAVSVDNTRSTAAALDAGGSGSDWGGAVSIEETGPDSSNTVTQRYTVRTNVTNNNDVSITNNNSQDARSGKASVENNTTGGSATSGDARNESLTTLEVTVKN